MRAAHALAGLTCFLVACGGPQQTARPTPTQPTPQSPTQPAPTNTANPPRVTVVFPDGPTCAGGVPCALRVTANAYATNGDTLTYRWSGCATGSSAQAVCAVNQDVPPAIASVEVSDRHGNTVTASATAQGSNRAPYVQLSNFSGLSSASPTLEALGNVIDPDDGVLCGGGSSAAGCGYVQSVAVSGDCRPTYYLDCSCLGGLELEIYRSASEGTCVVTIKATNRRGAAGTSIFTVPYHHGTGSLAVAPSPAGAR